MRRLRPSLTGLLRESAVTRILAMRGRRSIPDVVSWLLFIDLDSSSGARCRFVWRRLNNRRRGCVAFALHVVRTSLFRGLFRFRRRRILVGVHPRLARRNRALLRRRRNLGVIRKWVAQGPEP